MPRGMSSKLKVALSKVSHLPLFQGLALKHSAVDPHSAAEKFYLKTLPRMTTLPKTPHTAPSVNLWLWLIGYVRLQWPEVGRKSRTVFGKSNFRHKGNLLLKDVLKYLGLSKVPRQNAGLLKSIIGESSVSSQVTKKYENR